MSVHSPARDTAVAVRELATQFVMTAAATTPVPHVYFQLLVDYATREITIGGEFDSSTAPCLATAIAGFQHAARADITIRLDGVTFIDAAGIGAVARANAAQLRNGARLWVTGVTARTRRIFTLGHLSDLLDACQEAA